MSTGERAKSGGRHVRLVRADSDIWVSVEITGSYAVRRGRNTWPLTIHPTREEAMTAGRDLARVWRCDLIVLDGQGEEQIHETHRQ